MSKYIVDVYKVEDTDSSSSWTRETRPMIGGVILGLIIKEEDYKGMDLPKLGELLKRSMDLIDQKLALNENK